MSTLELFFLTWLTLVSGFVFITIMAIYNMSEEISIRLNKLEAKHGKD